MAETQNDDLQRIIVLMQAQDREFRVAMKKNADAMRRMTAEGDRDFRKLQQRMRALDQQAAAAAGAVGGWGKAFVAGMAGGVVTSLLGGISNDIAGVVKGIAAIGDEAKRAGLGVEAFQEWKYIAEQNRIGIDALVDGFKELNLRADEYVVTGAGSAAEAFNRLGYTAADLRDKLKDPSALMLEIIDRLHRVDQAARIRITDELFGGTGGEQLLQLLGMSSEKLREMQQRAHDLGLVLDESAVSAAAEIDKKFSEITGSIAAMLKKTIVDLADMSEEGAPAFVKLGRTIAEALEGFDPDSVNQTAEALTGIAGAAATAGQSVRAFDDLSYSQSQLLERAVALQGEMLALSQMLEAIGAYDAADQVNALIDRLDGLTDSAAAGKVQGIELRQALSEIGSEAESAVALLQGVNGIDLSGAQGAVGGLLRILGAAADAAARLKANMPGKAPPPTSSLSDDRGAAIAESRAGSYASSSPLAPTQSERPRERPSSAIDWGVPEVSKGGKGGGGGSQSEYQRATESIREQTVALEAEALALLATAESGKDYGDAVQYARRYAELLTAAQEDGRAITPELRAEVDQLAAAYVAAGEGAEAAREKLEAVRESAKRGEDALIGIFESVLDGSRSAKDALGDLLMEMAKVQLRQAAMGVFGGSGIGSFLGGMLTPLAGARASGGSVVGGRPYLVNENTPNSEVFVPSRGGAILTSAQAQEALRVRAVAPASGRRDAEIRVKVYVEDDGRLAAVAAQAGAQAALPVAVEVVKQNNRQQMQAQRRK